MYATIQNLGGGHGIRIPKALLDALGLRENDQVELSCQDGAITISKMNEPNAETRQAIENLKNGVNLSRKFFSVAELMEDLNAGD